MTTFFTIVRRSLAATAALAAVAAAGGALIATPAAAEVLPSTERASVSYAGLDLATPAGQAAMHTRMRAAARQVCGYNAGERDLGEIGRQNACIAQAMNGAEVSLAAVTGGTAASDQRVALGDAARNVPGRAR